MRGEVCLGFNDSSDEELLPSGLFHSRYVQMNFNTLIRAKTKIPPVHFLGENLTELDNALCSLASSINVFMLIQPRLKFPQKPMNVKAATFH